MKIFQKPSEVVGEYPTKTKWYLSNAKLFQLRRKARAAKPRTKWYLIGDPVIREKIRDHEAWAILTVWGVGYKFTVRA